MNDNLFYMDKDGNLCRNEAPKPNMNDKITEIKEALARATKEPWRINEAHDMWLEIQAGHGTRGTMIADCVHKRNAPLIAKSPEYITYLLQLAEYPKATGDDVTNGGWKLDYKFLREIERRIGESEFREERPSMEQIELSLLFAQELLKESI